jgi:hypothetical protein
MAGARAPHVWLRNGRSILDLFGRRFMLLRFGADAPDTSAFAIAAAARAVPLEVVSVPQDDARELYGRALVLVRPDGHVAWRGDDMPADPNLIVDRTRGALM